MTTQSEEEIIAAYEQELANVRQQASQNQSTYSSAMFNQTGKANLIEWELSFKEDFDYIERLLRSDVLAIDKQTQQQVWVRNPNPNECFLNEKGVMDILRALYIIVGKGTVLSNYNPEEIQRRVKMHTNEIRTLIYNNYSSYGMEIGTEEEVTHKMNNYSEIVIAIDSMIDSCYRRAMNSSAHKGLSEQRIVSQMDNSPSIQPGMYPGMMMGGGGQKKSGNKLWPWNWNRI